MGGGKTGENRGKNGGILTHIEVDLTVWVLDYGAVSLKLSEICDHRTGAGRKTGRQTDRHTDASDFIICPMLCYAIAMVLTKISQITCY